MRTQGVEHGQWRRAQRARATLRDDEQGVTAVVEFLGAFVLFLVVVTAFLSLAQLTLGTNDPSVDRLEVAAIDGLRTVTTSPGWLVPAHPNGSRDVANATDTWETANASVLNTGDLAPGLVSRDGRIVTAKVAALTNVTEAQLARGLGLDDGDSLRLELRVTESWDANRTGLVLVDAGSPRNASTSSSVSTRHLRWGNETILVTLEVHNAGRSQPVLRVWEFMPQPSGGAPEWVELHNPGDLAVEVTGFSLLRTGESGLTGSLVGSGYVQGGGLMLLSGEPSSQITGNASLVLDLGAAGTLGRGLIDGLANTTGTLAITHAEQGSAAAIVVQSISYDLSSWGGGSNQSYAYDGVGSHTDALSWMPVVGGTPGDL